MSSTGALCSLLAVSLTVVASEYTVYISQLFQTQLYNCIVCPSCDIVSNNVFGILNKPIPALISGDVQLNNLLNNTTLCANWSLPWGVLRS